MGTMGDDSVACIGVPIFICPHPCNDVLLPHRFTEEVYGTLAQHYDVQV